MDVIVPEGVKLPEYKSDGAVCCDLHANIPDNGAGQKRIALNHRASAKINTKLKVAIPRGFKIEIAAKSGWAERGLIVTNAPAQIDCDFRGEMEVLLINVGREIIEINDGDRFAQCWIEPAYRIRWNPVKELDVTERGEGGFGSTGVK